ncbi:MAG: nicotinate-nucleotide diphosphorylase (carboxylating) [Omnitrophica bacterium RIFCSPLOWO2_01_FULL_50_24]|nr:MAG: nicotinate-nucleotide diphosphorylase (carboxylating) [Omnitrophica bacterium RIFCSPLOWO2_01_FULL_50_24]
MLRITPHIRSLIRETLKEDIGSGDVTTSALIPRNLRGEALICVKHDGVLCGGAVVKEVFCLLDRRVNVIQTVPDRSQVKKGKKVFVIRGQVSSILKGERVALNFLGHLSGIATLTAQFVRRTRGTGAEIVDTRKTIPLWRALEKYAVRCGGGVNHRFGLWDEVLVKDNHWNAIYSKLEKSRCRYFGVRLRPLLRRCRIPVELEVAHMKSLLHLIEGPYLPDRILLDHFSVRVLRQAVRAVRQSVPKSRRPLLEASGNVHLGNVLAIARTGVDRISIGMLTQSAPALDVSLTLNRY